MQTRGKALAAHLHSAERMVRAYLTTVYHKLGAHAHASAATTTSNAPTEVGHLPDAACWRAPGFTRQHLAGSLGARIRLAAASADMHWFHRFSGRVGLAFPHTLERREWSS